MARGETIHIACERVSADPFGVLFRERNEDREPLLENGHIEISPALDERLEHPEGIDVAISRTL